MKVTFLPSGEEHEIEFNETILHLAQRKGLHIQSVCKGIPSCAECRIQIKEGEHHVLPPSKKEIDLIGTAHYIDLSRLSCQLRCFGDVTVDLSEQIEKEKRATGKPKERVRKDGKESHAVLGGILDDVVAEGVALDEEILQSKEVVKVEEVKGDPKLDKKTSFYGDFLGGEGKRPNKKNKNNRNKNRQDFQKDRKPKAEASQKDGNPQAGGQPSRPKKKRRNRNRNRNQNQAQNQNQTQKTSE